jgi:hypothetical protein
LYSTYLDGLRHGLKGHFERDYSSEEACASSNRGERPSKSQNTYQIEAAKVRLINAKVAESTLACLPYDLFRKLLRDEPKIQWDWIVTDMHTKKPWEDIKGANSLSAMDGHDRPLKN